MLLYCDTCARKMGYKIDEAKTSKGECELCHMRLGPMNYMPDDVVETLVNSISTDVFKAADFSVRQVRGFPVGTVVREIEPKMFHKMLTDDVSLFYDSSSRKIVLARPGSGKRIQITF